jgi:hypothetical protein
MDKTSIDSLNIYKRLSRDHPILAKVKYPCDCGTDNCNPVCLDVSYEVSDVMMSISLFFQQAHLWSFEKP